MTKNSSSDLMVVSGDRHPLSPASPVVGSAKPSTTKDTKQYKSDAGGGGGGGGTATADREAKSKLPMTWSSEGGGNKNGNKHSVQQHQQKASTPNSAKKSSKLSKFLSRTKESVQEKRRHYDYDLTIALKVQIVRTSST